MTIRVVYDSEMDCLLTSVTGPLDKEVALALLSEVGRVAVENQCTRVLSDLREAKIVASTAEIYRIAKSLGDTQITKAVKRAVVLGLEEGNRLEVLSGVESGDQVIVAGQGGLKDGETIKIIPDATEQASDRSDPAQHRVHG